VRSVITSPEDGAQVGKTLTVRGAAWAGDQTVRLVEISSDKGASWQKAELAPPKNHYDWTRFTAQLSFNASGAPEVWSRATDSAGKVQPNDAQGWNPQGYGANPVHRIHVTVR
jgi:sulfite oxidase